MADQTVTVPVKPAAASKINWTQLAGLAASVAAYFGLNLDPTTLVQVVLGIQAGQSLLTMILKTFFTKTVTPASIGQ